MYCHYLYVFWLKFTGYIILEHVLKSIKNFVTIFGFLVILLYKYNHIIFLKKSKRKACDNLIFLCIFVCEKYYFLWLFYKFFYKFFPCLLCNWNLKKSVFLVRFLFIVFHFYFRVILFYFRPGLKKGMFLVWILLRFLLMIRFMIEYQES